LDCQGAPLYFLEGSLLTQTEQLLLQFQFER
jgi:hypothetical protein